MASNGFNKALTGVGAAVMGVGALTDNGSLWLGSGDGVTLSSTANSMELKAIVGNMDYIMDKVYYQGFKMLRNQDLSLKFHKKKSRV